MAYDEGGLPASVPCDDNPLAERFAGSAVRQNENRPPARQHDLVGPMVRDIRPLVRIDLPQYKKIHAAGVQAQHARERRVEGMGNPGRMGDAAGYATVGFIAKFRDEFEYFIEHKRSKCGGVLDVTVPAPEVAHA